MEQASQMIQDFWQYPLVKSIVITLLCYLAYKVSITIFKKTLKKSKIDPNSHAFIGAFVKVVLSILTVLTILKMAFGVDITSFIAIFSVAGIAISLALQDSLSNLAGGVLLLFNRPFQKGDFISVNTIEGTIDEVGLVYTKLTTPENKTVFVPNSQMSKSTVLNANTDTTARLDLIYSIGYTANLQQAKDILLQIAKDSNLLLSTHEPFVAVSELADSGVKLLLRMWCENANKFPLKFYCNEQVKLRFDQNNIEIPYPKLEVKVEQSEKFIQL